MPKVSIIGGSAFSRRLEELSHDFLSHFPHVILIVPTQKYASFWERKIQQELNLNCIVGRYVYDFTNFVRVLLEEEDIKCELIEVWKQELIVKSILISEEGREKVAPYQLESPENLASHIVEVIRNFKQGGIEPDEFIRSIPESQRGLREDVIHWVYKRYQEVMFQNSWYDVPGMFWMAEEVCKQRIPALLKNVECILLEGFDDFTNSEIRLLKAIESRVESLSIYLNYDASPEKQDLYKLSHKTLENLKRFFPAEIKILESSPPKNRIQFVAQNLYWRESPRKIDFDAGDIRICFYPNRDTEIRETAREIKKLILMSSISPARIALIFRKLEPVQKIVERVFDEFQIPYSINYRRKFKETIVGRFLWSWFTHLLDDKVLSLLQIFYNPLWNIPSEVRIKTSLILRKFEVNLNHPIEILEQRLESFPIDSRVSSSNIEEDEDDEGESVISIEEVNIFNEEIKKWLRWRRDFTSVQSLDDFIVVTENFLKEIIGALDLRQIVESQKELEESKEGVNLFLRELKEVSKFFSNPKLDLELLIEIILDLLQGIVVGSELKQGVFVSELPNIRNLKFDYVFLCGVERGAIPLHRRINALYSEKEITEISKRYQIPVETLEDHLLRERLLFQKVFESAVHGVYLSYALFSEVNSETAPSLLINDVLELCEVLQYDSGYNKDVFTPPVFDLPCSQSELKLIKFLTLPLEQIFEEYSSESLKAQTYKVRLKNEKGKYFGVIEADDLLKYICEKYDDKHIYSADQIERYIDCPFIFFTKRILSLSDWERDTDEPSPALIGSWAHKSLHHLLRDHLDKVSTREDIPEIVSNVVDNVVDNDLRSRFFPSGIINVFKNRLKILIMAMVKEGLISKEWHPEYFEISFGDTKYEDEESCITLPPFSWDINGRKVLFSGRIDRIDTRESGGRKVAKIIDYKWRKVPSQLSSRKRDFTEDDIVSIQLTLYGLAVGRHILSCENVETKEGSFFIVYPDGNRKSREVKAKWSGKPELIEKWYKMTGKRVLSVINKIRLGYFPPQPRNDDICDRCQWLNSCKYKKSLHRELAEEHSEDEKVTE